MTSPDPLFSFYLGYFTGLKTQVYPTSSSSLISDPPLLISLSCWDKFKLFLDSVINLFGNDLWNNLNANYLFYFMSRFYHDSNVLNYMAKLLDEMNDDLVKCKALRGCVMFLTENISADGIEKYKRKFWTKFGCNGYKIALFVEYFNSVDEGVMMNMLDQLEFYRWYADELIYIAPDLPIIRIDMIRKIWQMSIRVISIDLQSPRDEIFQNMFFRLLTIVASNFGIDKVGSVENYLTEFLGALKGRQISNRTAEDLIVVLFCFQEHEAQIEDDWLNQGNLDEFPKVKLRKAFSSKNSSKMKSKVKEKASAYQALPVQVKLRTRQRNKM